MEQDEEGLEELTRWIAKQVERGDQKAREGNNGEKTEENVPDENLKEDAPDERKEEMGEKPSGRNEEERAREEEMTKYDDQQVDEDEGETKIEDT